MNEKIETLDTKEPETAEKKPNKYFVWWTGATLATKITFVRLMLIPFIMFFYIGANEFSVYFFNDWGKIIALILFIVAALTDYLDGWIARKYNQVSDTGKLFDPIADKLLVLTGLVLIVTDPSIMNNAHSNFLPAWAATFVVFIPVARDIVIAIVRQLALNKGIVIGADNIAKAKSIFLFIATALFMLYAANATRVSGETFLGTGTFFDVFRYIAWTTMVIALALTIISCVNYIVKFNKGAMEKS